MGTTRKGVGATGRKPGWGEAEECGGRGALEQAVGVKGGSAPRWCGAGEPRESASESPAPSQIFWVGPFIGAALAVLIYDFILAPRSSDLTDRVKVWTSGQVEEYDLDADDVNARVEMKPK